MPQDSLQSEIWSSSESGDGVTVEVTHGPLIRFPSIAGAWVGTYSYPECEGSAVVFCLLLRQDGDGSRLTGLTVEFVPIQDASLVADLVGRMSASGDLTLVKTYRNSADAEAIEYRGSLSTDSRAIGGSWTIAGQSGTFVVRRVTMGLGAQQW